MHDVCFIFIKSIEEENFLSILLDERGDGKAPLLTRSAEELKNLQSNARTVVVLPATLGVLHTIELPWLAINKARAAIPYALEEQLASPVTDLHFAFSKEFYQQGKYLVVVIEKSFLRELMQKLDAQDINFEAITLDWFALNPGEAICTDNTFLMHDSSFCGGLHKELAQAAVDNRGATSETITLQEADFYLWVAKRLQHMPIINLCQGELQPYQRKGSYKFWYRALGILAVVGIISLFTIHALHVFMLKKEIRRLDQQIAGVYKVFFPKAHQVISPRFRVQQLLKSGGSTNNMALWILLEYLAKTFDSQQCELETLNFQNQILGVQLNTKDFVTLENIVFKLRELGAQVIQKEAASQGLRVKAKLELKL